LNFIIFVLYCGTLSSFFMLAQSGVAVNMKIVGSGQWGVGSKTETTEKVRFSRKKGCDLGTVRLSNALFMRLRNRPHVEALSNQAYFHHYLCRVRPAWQLI
jgi:hypothetical protein